MSFPAYPQEIERSKASGDTFQGSVITTGLVMAMAAMATGQ